MHRTGVPWNQHFLQTIWLLWKRRCRFAFQQIPVNTERNCSSVSGVREFISLQEKQADKMKEEIYIRWTPPPGGWFELNSNGSADASLERAGAGSFLRDSDGGWTRGCIRHLSRTSSLVAELWALRDGLLINGATPEYHKFSCWNWCSSVVVQLILSDSTQNLLLMPHYLRL